MKVVSGVPMTCYYTWENFPAKKKSSASKPPTGSNPQLTAAALGTLADVESWSSTEVTVVQREDFFGGGISTLQGTNISQWGKGKPPGEKEKHLPRKLVNDLQMDCKWVIL